MREKFWGDWFSTVASPSIHSVNVWSINALWIVFRITYIIISYSSTKYLKEFDMYINQIHYSTANSIQTLSITKHLWREVSLFSQQEACCCTVSAQITVDVALLLLAVRAPNWQHLLKNVFTASINLHRHGVRGSLYPRLSCLMAHCNEIIYVFTRKSWHINHFMTLSYLHNGKGSRGGKDVWFWLLECEYMYDKARKYRTYIFGYMFVSLFLALIIEHYWSEINCTYVAISKVKRQLSGNEPSTYKLM